MMFIKKAKKMPTEAILEATRFQKVRLALPELFLVMGKRFRDYEKLLSTIW
jgi:hypothetical protein